MTFEKFRKLNTITFNPIPSCKQARKVYEELLKNE